MMFLWEHEQEHEDNLPVNLALIIPLSFFANGLWLAWIVWVAHGHRQPNGAKLPTRFSAVLYLDAFAWVRKFDKTLLPQKSEREIGPQTRAAPRLSQKRTRSFGKDELQSKPYIPPGGQVDEVAEHERYFKWQFNFCSNC